jgi:hypothetical protein
MTAGLAAQVRPASRKTAYQSIAWKRRLWRASGGAYIAHARENQKPINDLNGSCAHPHLPKTALDPFSGAENNVETTN